MPLIICGCTSSEERNTHRGCVKPRHEYVGAVLGEYEHNGGHDSDFYAVVWDEPTQSVTTKCWGTTSSWTYHNHCRVDATPEVIAKANASMRPRWTERLRARMEADARLVRVGRVVRSTTTRGKNAGLVGEVAWKGRDKIRSTRYHTYYRVGIDVDGTRRFMPVENVEVVEPAPVNEAELAQSVESAVRRDWPSQYRSFVYTAGAPLPQ
ncbi:hypothetical protein [Nocardia sp. NRRL S-836]|uniref:hypothetical protein n=1 Tax=Nocardia sp. NRRL S-836 TaxID=1519492 RepID=UPI0006AE79D9|nr:hypothetical protein [Nocardia sp. NRRL S-836]KOV84757.1 hypothetical protein ADL03_15955 [Nocardia sp. NRRL S-836]